MVKKQNIRTFQEALKLADTNKHLLLGNGFSIALKPDIFSYISLFEECKNSNCVSNETLELFKKYNTKDFEIIIKALIDTSRVLQTYKQDRSFINQLKKEAEKLKDVLVKLISSRHPSNPSEIIVSQYTSCIEFLSKFKRIYTLNYDLLLYWVIMKAVEEKVQIKRYDDGFRYAENEDYVVWSPKDGKHQNVYYLHGALHLFDTGAEIKKYTWINTGITLLEQVKNELKQNNFPLFVAEGTSQEKMTRINHSQYLGKGIRSFSEISGSLFVYGHSFSNSDSHYINLITKNNIAKLFVSIYDCGTKETEKISKAIMQKAEILKTKCLTENKPKKLEIYYFDAISAKVWG